MYPICLLSQLSISSLQLKEFTPPNHLYKFKTNLMNETTVNQQDSLSEEIQKKQWVKPRMKSIPIDTGDASGTDATASAS